MKQQTKVNTRKKCKHEFESDGGECIKCRRTVADIVAEQWVLLEEKNAIIKNMKNGKN